MGQIQLSCGRVAVVDDDLVDILSRYTWRSYAGKRCKILYARRTVSFPVFDGRRPEVTTVYMHQQILRWFDGIDHINHDGLDNRRANLPRDTTSQNMQNQRKRGGVTSRFLGVHFDRTRKTNQWKAEINVNKVRKLLGGFSSEVEAARVYEEAALREL